VRLTPSTAPICSTVSSRASYILRACRTCSVDGLARSLASPAYTADRLWESWSAEFGVQVIVIR